MNALYLLFQQLGHHSVLLNRGETLEGIAGYGHGVERPATTFGKR